MKPFPLIPAIILSILVLLLFGCGTKEKTTRTGAPVSSATGERYPASQTRTQTPVPSQGPRVGAVASSRIATDACHCLFSPMGGTQSAAAGQWVFYEDAGSGDAWMNIDGRDVQLRKRPDCQQYRCTYQGSGVTARIQLQEQGRCPAVYECDGQDYEVSIQVEKGGRTTSFAGYGRCAC